MHHFYLLVNHIWGTLIHAQVWWDQIIIVRGLLVEQTVKLRFAQEILQQLLMPSANYIKLDVLQLDRDVFKHYNSVAHIQEQMHSADY